MIAAIRGTLVRVLEDQVRLELGGIEYQVLVPELVRRSVQTKLGEEITLHTIEYLEGNATKGRLVPRLVGFLTEPEMEFFELFCSVDGIGVRKALKALVRPVRDIADMIQRQDAQILPTLPGIGSSTAERVIAKLRKKVVKFALMVQTQAAATDVIEPDVLEDAFQALVSVGHGEAEARKKLEAVLVGRKKKFTSAQEILQEVYQRN